MVSFCRTLFPHQDQNTSSQCLTEKSSLDLLYSPTRTVYSPSSWKILSLFSVSFPGLYPCTTKTSFLLVLRSLGPHLTRSPVGVLYTGVSLSQRSGSSGPLGKSWDQRLTSLFEESSKLVSLLNSLYKKFLVRPVRWLLFERYGLVFVLVISPMTLLRNRSQGLFIESGSNRRLRNRPSFWGFAVLNPVTPSLPPSRNRAASYEGSLGRLTRPLLPKPSRSDLPYWCGVSTVPSRHRRHPLLLYGTSSLRWPRLYREG